MPGPIGGLLFVVTLIACYNCSLCLDDPGAVCKFTLSCYIEFTADKEFHIIMADQEMTDEDLERFAAALVQALPDLECPECCEQGWKYQYVELSAQFYRDHWEWHCLLSAINYRRQAKT